MGKIIGGIIVGIIVIIAIVVGVLYFNLDKAIIAAVEKYGSEVTQTDVKLGGVDLDLTKGKGALKSFSVGNPKGFDEPNAFRFDTVSVAVDISGSSEKLIHIQEVRIAKPEITYEVNQTTNNLDAIKKNVDDFMKANGMGGEKKAEPKESESEGPKVIIDNLYITGGKVNVKAPILANKKVEGSLPEIHLKDIGKSKGGASPGEVAAQIINSVTGKAMTVITDLGIGKNIGTLLDNAGDLAKKLNIEGAGGAAKNAVEGAGGVAKGAVEGAGSTIKGLLGGSKE